MANYSITGSRIDVTGFGLGDYQPVIFFPSGQFAVDEAGSQLEAVLTQLNASFGFNTTPHTFSTTWVPIKEDPLNFHGASGQAPLVGKIMGFTVGEFLVSGEINHSDYSVDPTGGTIVSVSIRDTRRCLDKVTIITEDLGDNPGSGMISVARGIRIVDGFADLDGNISEEKFREYRKILEQGCTYPQILTSIQLAIDSGELDFDISSIPTQEELEANLGGTASALRFNFQSTPLGEAITTILQASAYDWYWSMSQQKVKLVNRKYAFDLREDQLLEQIAQLGAVSGLEQTTRLSFGDDFVTQPRKVTLLGSHQEGWINSPILSPLDGLDTQASGVIFYPAWGTLTVQFTDAYGILRSYKPTDLELQAAIRGIEYWTYFKKYQTAPKNFNNTSPGFGLAADAGSIAAQHPDFQSRIDPAQPIANIGGNESGQIRLITNRRDANQNWIINFYNRVQDHANTYFGRAYIASGILANAVSGAYKLSDSAWSNIENQIEGQTLSVDGSSGLFINNYEINRDLGIFAPFKGTDDKISAHCVLPSGTVYGPEGDDSPAGFGQWTEDYFFPIDPVTGELQNYGITTSSSSGRRARTGEHYIPVGLSEVGELSIDPRDSLAAFEEYPEGTVLCQLPIIAGSGLSTNAIFGNLVTLAETALEADGSGLLDTINPALLIEPYQVLSGVAIPVQSTYRYGMSYPQPWTSGNLATECDAELLSIDDGFAPWNFPPQGTQTSIQIMNDRALRRLEGLVAPASTSKYAEVALVGLPKISFDSFSNDEPDANGRIGIRNHGITSINFALGTNGVTSNYKIASFFSTLTDEAPLGERQRAILNGIINPIDTSLIDNPLSPSNRRRDRPSPPMTFIGAARRGEVTRKVTIDEVNNALSFSSTPSAGTQERYRGKNTQGYDAPPIRPGSDDEDFKGTGGAICVDGFLNIGDEAIYHVNELRLPNGRLEIQRYFTGGRPFSNGTVVLVSGIGSSAGLYDVALQGTNPLRKLVDVPVLNGSISVGALTTLAAQADSSTSRSLGRPGAALTKDGVYINPGGGGTPSIPVQIIAVSSPGSSSARVNVQTLQSNGTVDLSGTITTNIIPLPFPQFATSGDIGLLIEDGGNTFFMGNRQNFIRFT